MKRFSIAAIIVALAIAPFTAQADDIPDGQDCRDGTADPVATGSEPDRGAVCINAGGTVILYIGGEGQAEEEPGTGGACGTIIVADQTFTGTDDWDNPDEGTHCD